MSILIVYNIKEKFCLLILKINCECENVFWCDGFIKFNKVVVIYKKIWFKYLLDRKYVVVNDFYYILVW